jgi:uncharacterized membrane protein
MLTLRLVRTAFLLLAVVSLFAPSMVQAQGAKQTASQTPIADSDQDHVQERARWFYRGRLVHGHASADLRHRAYATKLQMRAQHAAALAAIRGNAQEPTSPVGWVPLGPVPLASDATGNGTQDYHQVSGRATAVAIDPADSTGNTVYIGGAQGGVWKSINAANVTASNVTWFPVTDDQATLSIGSIAIQPGNTNLTSSVILVGTGEADNSADSYFGLGILRSADSGNTWTLIPTANGGALSFNGLGGTRMAFSTANGQTNTVVSAMATTSEGMVDGAVTVNTSRGLYTSLDAGQTWTYDALVDPGGATDATSSTSVVFNAGAGLFFAAIRYHGFYSSPDGVTWTRLTNQPGGSLLSTSVCPPQSTSNSYACPIYRAEISVVPGRNEMYAWFIYFDTSGSIVDGGIWQSLDGGISWNAISDTGITTCGDIDGCGVEQGSYNLELLAVPDGAATDLYAGAINLYKCGITTANLNCTVSPFINLTHVYGCDPIGAPAHVHPDQHALAYTIPVAGSDSGNALLYFANDGGIYRALNGFSGLTIGSCSGVNQFDNLNQNLGSMTQFVSFSQHPSDANTLLGGTQDNGSPATNQATINTGWTNVLGGDGGYNAIDPNLATNWYASNPDTPPGGLGIQECTSGVNCNNSSFSAVVTSNSVGGDDGGFYFPYILDPQSTTAMLVGTCRVWRGSRVGGTFTVLSPNFDTFGAGTCAGTEVNQVRALAAGGQTDSNGSKVIYATTSGSGPLDGPLTTPSGGHVWVTTNATAGTGSFADVTNNGPSGSINPNQFPISSVAVDASDASGFTAYVTMMGFTGGTGHVWKTTNAGATWTDYTANLPDVPVNAVVVDTGFSQVYIGTDVGVFASSTVSAAWTELGPISSTNSPGFLPNVAVTALGLFNAGGQKLLRASTYGRGIWQWNLASDFSIAIANSTQIVDEGTTAMFDGTVTALRGFTSSVALSCVPGATSPPTPCTPNPTSLFPTVNTPFTLAAGGAIGDYFFNVQAVGSDSNSTTHQVPIVLHVVSTNPDFVLDESSTFPTVNAGSDKVSGSASITAVNGFTGTVTLTCSLSSANGNCSVSPASVSSFPATVNVTVNAVNLSAGSYALSVQGTSDSSTHTLPIPINVGDYQLTGTPSLTLGPGTQGTATLTLTSSTFYSGDVNATCDASALAGATCTLSPTTLSNVLGDGAATITALITAPTNSPAGTYNIKIGTQDTTGVPSHSFTIVLTVSEDFAISSSTTSQSVNAGQTTGPYNLTVQPTVSAFNSAVTFSCSSGLPSGAQCIFTPNPVTPGTNTASVAMTISTAATTPAGAYSVTVVATSGSLTHSTTVSLNVGDYSITGTQALTLALGGQGTATFTLKSASAYSGMINATCDASALSGTICALSPANPITLASGGTATITATIDIPTNSIPGNYTINFNTKDTTGAPSHSLALTLTVGQDFEVLSSTPSQTITAGQTTGPYNLTVQPVGSSFTGAVTLTCSGLPAMSQCLFSPATAVTPGTSAVAVVMTISTVASSAKLQPWNHLSPFYAMWLILPGIILAWGTVGRGEQRSRYQTVGSSLSIFILMLLLTSCGGGGSNGGTTTGGQQGTKPGSYPLLVTGTSPGTAPDSGQSVGVILVVN